MRCCVVLADELKIPEFRFISANLCNVHCKLSIDLSLWVSPNKSPFAYSSDVSRLRGISEKERNISEEQQRTAKMQLWDFAFSHFSSIRDSSTCKHF